METWTGIVLRHRPTGLFYGRDLEKTRSLRKAFRWRDEEEFNVWIEASIYAPPHPDEYEPVTVRITLELEEST